jgi:ABC transporter with metal-binding/Fe-S-binding domain ATP-binding protein
MRVCILYSGGKDSNLALLKAYEVFDVVCLVTISPKSEESSIFHYPNTQLVKLQAESLKLPLIMETCLDDEESSLNALYNVLKDAKELYDAEGVVTGAIKSTYQVTRFQRVCDDLELWCFNPLWLRDEISLLNEALDYGFEIIFTRVAGYPLKKSILGKKLTREVVQTFGKMRKYLNPSGEGGEYETFVLDMPLFTKKLKIVDCVVVGDDYDATLIVKKAVLVEK